MKMKKKVPLILIAVAAALFLIVLVCLQLMPRSQVSEGDITIQYKKNGAIVSCTVSSEEGACLRRILSGHAEHRENYSCGFSPGLAVSSGDTMFYIAFDACPIIYDTSTDRFFQISKADKQSIADVFSKYGGAVNCE